MPPVPTNTVSLFYPGQSSYQWLRSPETEPQSRPLSLHHAFR
jgi:hypothetical protein